MRVGPATLAYLGPHGGAVLRAGTIEGYPAQEDLEVDEVLVIEETLAGRERLQFGIPILFRQGGCNGPGGSVTFHNFPTVEVSYLGRERVVASDDDLVFTQVGASRGCAVHD